MHLLFEEFSVGLHTDFWAGSCPHPDILLTPVCKHHSSHPQLGRGWAPAGVSCEKHMLPKYVRASLHHTLSNQPEVCHLEQGCAWVFGPECACSP